MQVVISGSRNLYPYFPVLYESLFAHDKDVTLWIMAEDDKLPYEVPDNVRVVNVSGQTIFREDGPNSRSPFTYLAMIRAAYPLLFNGGSYGGMPKLPKLDRVISLDCDIVCCDTLKPIWDADLTDKWFGAVAEFVEGAEGVALAGRGEGKVGVGEDGGHQPAEGVGEGPGLFGMDGIADLAGISWEIYS